MNLSGLEDYPDEILKLKYMGKTYDMRLGKIEDSKVFVEDHGILTCYITFNFGSSVQGFGGYFLDTYHDRWKKRTGKPTKEGKDWLQRACDVLDVSKIENAKGEIAYALYKEGDSRGMIIGIKSPKFETNKIFLVNDWKKRWGFKDD